MLFLVIVVLYEYCTSYIINKRATFNLKQKPTMVVIGHSHSECAFNDSVIADFQNLSQSADSYFYIYQKVRLVLQANPEIETVFIEFSNNNIRKEMDLWKNPNKYTCYSPFLNLNDHVTIITDDFQQFLNNFSVSSKNRLIRVMNNDYNYPKILGGYNFLVRNKTDSLVKNISPTNANHTTENDRKIDFSYGKQIEYLDKTIALCKKMRVEVFLVRSPLQPLYKGYKYEEKYQSILRTHYADIEHLDFSKFPLSNSEFGDLNHLNHKGAKVFSSWFQSLIEGGLLKAADKTEFVKKELGKIRLNK